MIWPQQNQAQKSMHILWNILLMYCLGHTVAGLGIMIHIHDMIGSSGNNIHVCGWYWLCLYITMTSHELVVSNHRSLDCLLNSLCGPSSKKHQSHYWAFVDTANWRIKVSVMIWFKQFLSSIKHVFFSNKNIYLRTLDIATDFDNMYM